MTSETPHIDYPCWWTYAVIGGDEEDLRMAVATVVRGRQHKVHFSKLSAHGKYSSLHVELWVENEEERNAAFEEFRTNPNVRMVL